jgi:putative lysine transport system permease protein
MSWSNFIDIINKYWPMYIRGAGLTLLISIIGTLLGSLIGLIIGTIRTIPMPEKGWKRILLKIINVFIAIYVEVFRGTPMIVQAMVIYYGSAMAGLYMDRTAAAIFIVSINTGAYTAEIVRGGIISIDKGQFEAAHALGMNHAKTMLYVVLPQVLRNILPPIGNEFVINIKDTSVLNVISVSELYFQTATVSTETYCPFESFFVACIIYLTMTLTITRILRMIERKMEGPDSYIIMPGNQMQVERPEDKMKRA